MTLVGSSNELEVHVQGVLTRALIDTGSSVSTLSRSFYDTYLHDIPLQPVECLLTLECADGTELPYHGVISCELQVDGIADSPQTIQCLFLIVNDTKYHESVPVLIGTNILSVLLSETKDRYGVQFLQKVKVHTPWFIAFRCMTLRERRLSRRAYVLARVRSAEERPVTIAPNSSVTIQGYLFDKLPYRYYPVCGMLSPTARSRIPTDLDIEPSVITYDTAENAPIPVHVSNITTNTVTINPRALLCEVQQVSIQNFQRKEQLSEASDVFSQVNLPRDELSEDQLQKVQGLLSKFDSLFSKGDTDIGYCPYVEHRIELNDESPFKQRFRRIPPSMLDEVREHLEQQLSAGIIRRSHSPFSSNVVLVRKKDGQLRICIDYRHLNSRTKKDNYALPRIDEILDSLAGNTYFSVLDMKSGYYQIPIAEEHKERTAFTVGPLGFFEHNRMAMGLVNAPATYQRLMEECLGDLHHHICFIYLDDAIVFSGENFDEHLDRLKLVFQRLMDSGIKLSPKKCALFRRRVKYVGHVVSASGIEPDDEKIQKVREWPTPTKAEEVRKFLGFVGYYRKFIKDFSKIARPLTNLIPSTTRSKTTHKKTTKKPDFVWEKDQEEAFSTLKECLTSAPILAYPNFDLPFEIHTDASASGLGAILYQKQEGKHHVIAYASRGLSKSEKNYPAHKLEFLALKWAITEKFQDYLYGKQFTVITDNNPLTYVLSTAKLDATGHRWIAALAAFDFDILYRPGRNNSDADALSRLPALESTDYLSISTDCIRTISSIHRQPHEPYIESVSFNSETLHPLMSIRCQEIQEIDIEKAQHQDPIIRDWIYFVEQERFPEKHDLPPTQESTIFRKNFKRFKIIDNKLYRERMTEFETHQQLVIPPELVSEVLRMSHDNLGHPGRDKTTAFIRERFFWPGMTGDIEQWIKGCKRCLLRKSPTNIRAPLVNIQTSQPLELVCLDYLSLESSKGGYQHILVITDHFTKYAVAIPTKNQTAKTTAEAFYNNFVIHYGLPKRLHSDQGANFESKLIKELCELTGIERSRTTPYHPMGNGLTERFNRTLLQMLGTLTVEQKQNWKKYVGPMVHAYNSLRQETTGQTPYLLMYGRQPLLPVDIAFGLSDGTKKQPMSSYVADLKIRLEKAHEIAMKATKLAQERQKRFYDQKIRGNNIKVGDRVLVKIVAFDGKHKLSNRWEEDPYVVLSQPNPEIPVFVVKKENGEGRQRTLHRNLLLPIETNFDDQDKSDNRPIPAPRRKRKVRDVNRQPVEIERTDDTDDDADDDSDDESEIFFVTTKKVKSVPRHTTQTSDIPLDTSGDDYEDKRSQSMEAEEDASHSVMEENASTSENSVNTSTDDVTEGADHDEVSKSSVEDTNTNITDNDISGTKTRPPLPLPRRSHRTTKPPQWMRDGEFAINMVCRAMLNAVLDKE